MTASELRRELSARYLAWAEGLEHEATYGSVPCVLHAEQEGGGHGNFLPASWRRIQARSSWRRRLEKTYTASKRIPHSHDRCRGELEAATSSDALLMNLFCFPGMLRRPAVLRLLGTAAGLSPSFGVRAEVPLRNGDADRTELGLRLDDLLLEAKLTETGFQTARPGLVMRYRDLELCFEPDELPRTPTADFDSYQLLRGVLAAHALDCRFAVVLDRRRTDLVERWFAVLRAVHSSDLRSRLQLLSWQELASASPTAVRHFLACKYGIEPA
jgi:hypothetical protein